MSDEPSEVIVLETADLMELRLAQNLFEQEGIPCSVTGSSASAFLGAALGSQFEGVHQLLVPADCEARALRVIREAWPERAG